RSRRGPRGELRSPSPGALRATGGAALGKSGTASALVRVYGKDWLIGLFRRRSVESHHVSRRRLRPMAVERTSAAARWRADLESWAIPEEILDAAPETPWGCPVDLFARRADSHRRPTPSDVRA